MFVTPAYAQAAGSTGAAGAFAQFIPLILIFAIMYFLMIRPQQKRAKLHREMVAALKTACRAGHGLAGRRCKGGRARSGGRLGHRLDHFVDGPHDEIAVVALGPWSGDLLKPLGIDLQVYPVKGYSLTIPITDAGGAPESTVMDEYHKVAITRLGDRIRVGGMAELSGFNLALNPRRHDTLAMVVRDLFPQGGNLEQATFWTGLRPMTPDGTPLVGPSPIPGLWLNTGHGTLGWTMAAGSGQLLSDLISGNTPDISDEGLTLARYG